MKGMERGVLPGSLVIDLERSFSCDGRGLECWPMDHDEPLETKLWTRSQKARDGCGAAYLPVDEVGDCWL